MHIAGSWLAFCFGRSCSILVSIVPRLVLDRDPSSNGFEDLFYTCVRSEPYCMKSKKVSPFKWKATCIAGRRRKLPRTRVAVMARSALSSAMGVAVVVVVLALDDCSSLEILAANPAEEWSESKGDCVFEKDAFRFLVTERKSEQTRAVDFQ